VVKPPAGSLTDFLTLLNDRPNDFEPNITEIDASAMNEMQMAHTINQSNVWMVVCGVSGEGEITTDDTDSLNWNSVLNSIACPLLLIPKAWVIKNIERLVYIADLRYCRLQIVRFLTELARAFYADLSIAQFAASGLPHMDEDYARQLFNDEINAYVKYDQLFFNNIKEPDLNITLDVLINGMHNDMLVVLNHRFHFKEIVGKYVAKKLPQHVSVPVLVFPY
jgi:hypothetical protein